MRGVASQARVGDPADLGALLEVLCQGEGVLGVALGAQRQRLGAEQQLLGGKRVEVGAEVAHNLDARADDEGGGPKCLPELEAVVALGGLDKLREARGVGAPVKLAAVDNDAADGGAVAANPLGGRVHDNVGAMVDGAQEVTTSAKCVVDLCATRLAFFFFFLFLPDFTTRVSVGATYNKRDALGVRNLGNGL